MFFVLKLSKLCNLRCNYCYEYDELGLADRMPLDGLERFFAWLSAHQPAGGWPPMNFVFHGGEPLLLPRCYLEAIVTSQRRHLEPAGIKYGNSLQTNLTRLDDAVLESLMDLNIGLGVSLDVFGGQRVTGRGSDSQDRVLANLQILFDRGFVQRRGVGIISVLHRHNIDRLVAAYDFCSDLGLSYRVLPVFALGDMPARLSALTLSHEDIVAALKRLSRRWIDTDFNIDVFPLKSFLDAAMHSVLGLRARTYDPRKGDWAYIVNTNGDTYSHSEAYMRAGWMGNIFKDPLRIILDSADHEKTLEPRLQRALTCDACRFGEACSRVALVEALPSERAYSPTGHLQCPIALPMIEYFRRELLHDSGIADLIKANLVEAQLAGRVAPAVRSRF